MYFLFNSINFVKDLGEKIRQFTLLMQPFQTLKNVHPHHNSLFWIPIFFFFFLSPVVIYFNFIRIELTLQWTSTSAPAVAGRLTSKGSIHLQGSLLFVRRKQKHTAYPTVLAASVRPQHADHGLNSYRRWCSLVSTQHRHCV